MTPDPVTRSLVAVDIEGFGRRGDLEHVDLRKALRELCADAFMQAGAEGAYREDRGDALLFVIGPEVSKPRLASDLVRELDTVLHRWNSSRLPQARMRLRMALHNGDVLLDGEGLAGETVVVLMRLLDAEQLRQALRSAPHDLAVIVSARMYHDAVSQGHMGINPAEYSEVHVSLKEFSQPAWIRVPGLASAGEPAELAGGQRPAASTGASAPATGGVHFMGAATFHGPASFGSGDAIGGNLDTAGRDIYAAGRDSRVSGTSQDA